MCDEERAAIQVRAAVDKNQTRGMQPGLVLVVFFDGQYSWCTPSVDGILPYARHFSELWNAKKRVNQFVEVRLRPRIVFRFHHHSLRTQEAVCMALPTGGRVRRPNVGFFRLYTVHLSF